MNTFNDNNKHVLSLFITNLADKILLRQFLLQSGYDILEKIPKTLEDWSKVSLIITDEKSAKTFGKELLKIKTELNPIFLPMIIILPKKTDSFHWLHSGIDEALRLPLVKNELIAKLNNLLQLRDQTE